MQFLPEEVEILRGILEEAPDYLSDLEEQILTLERGNEVEILDSLFRSFHSLKGIAGFANLTPIVASCHKAEDLIKEMKGGKTFPIQEVIDALLGVRDFVQQILGYLEEALATYSGGILKIDFTQFQEDRVVAKVEHILSREEEGPSVVEAQSQKKTAIVDEAFVQEALRDFLVELEENLTQAEDILLRLESEPLRGEYVDIVMRAFHSIKGGARLVLSVLVESSRAEPFRSIERIAHHLEDLFQEVRDARTAVSETLFRKAYTGIDLIKNIHRSIVKGEPVFSLKDAEIFLGAETEKFFAGEAEKKEVTLEAFLNIAEQLLEVLKDFSVSPSQEEIEQVVRLSEAVKSGLTRLGLETCLALVEEITERARAGDVSFLREAQAEFSNFVAAIKEQKKAKKKEKGQLVCPPAGISHDTAHTVRVDREKLERMLNLVGELLILKNATRAFVRKIAGESLNLLSEAKNIASGLERLTAEFQSMVLSLRMVPVAELFARYRRTVRDLAKSLGKNVVLVIESGDTELDRMVIEKLVDPLTHLVRNAVDHGIEGPEERERCGKGKEGKIILRAYYRGAYAFVEVEDDGRGVDVQAVRVKAVERGLVSSEHVLQLSDQEVLSFLFAPGFSTARVVSDLSGRGVGMDVVKTNVESIGGRVDIDSAPGKGTTVRMRIPLSLLVIRGLMVGIGDERYIFPLDFVRETVKIPRKLVREYFNGRFGEVRGAILPLVFAEEFLSQRPISFGSKIFDFNLVPLVVVGNGDETFAIVVDRFLEEGEYLVKAVPEYMRGDGLVSGITIMGDGSVVVILNPQRVVQ